MTTNAREERLKRKTSKDEEKARLAAIHAASREFDNEIPTEEAAWNFLAGKLKEEKTKVCKHCGCDELTRVDGTRDLICNNCSKISSSTVGTFFEGKKLARPRVAFYWFLERKICLSINMFKELLGIAYQTAWDIFNEFATVIRNNIPIGAVAVLSSNFKAVVGRRSRETPARAHPQEEQAEFEREHARQSESENQFSFADDLSEQGQEIYKVLLEQPVTAESVVQRTGMPLSSVLTNLTVLEISGFVTRVSGNRYAHTSDGYGSRINSNSSELNRLPSDTATEIASFIGFVRTNFQRISRKYLQNFNAIYWCCTDTKWWGEGKLMEACLRADRISKRALRCYISPLHIQVMPE
jgi:hypothetical protein